VINLPFGKSVEKEDFVYKESPFTDWKDLSEKGFLVVAMLGAVFVIRSLLSKMRVQVRSDGGGGGGFSGTSDQTVAALRAKRANIALPNPEDEISEDAAYRAERRKKITSYVQEKPAEASQLLKVWLAED
jgi:flagellar biosynthesis/type III secretory pathway M-ring protein FliF/YscJ